MGNDKVVGTGRDGHGSHREVVSRNCAVKLGRNKDTRQLHVVPSPRKDGVFQVNCFLNSIPGNSKGSMEVPIYVRHFSKQ